MLYALAKPASLAVLLLAFLVAVTLMGWVSSLLARRYGDPRPAQEGRLVPDPRRQVDPFGAVSAAIVGLGWARTVDLPGQGPGRGGGPRGGPRGGRGPAVLVALTGPLVVLGLGLGLLIAWRTAYGVDSLAPLPLAALVGGPAVFLQQGGPAAGGGLLFLAGCSWVFLGALSLVPLPPLPGGRLMLALAPRTRGWQQAEYQLVERNIGVAVLLALLLIPLGGGVPLLPALLDIALTPLVRAVSGA